MKKIKLVKEEETIGCLAAINLTN